MTHRNLEGHVIIVTGANSGIGKVTARELAAMDATVVMVCRNRERGEVARREIVKASDNENVDLLLADLSSQAEIRRVVREFKQQYDRLDVLVNNAGALFQEQEESVDGIEMTFALNHLGYFLLTHLLLDRLKDSAPARIVNVASNAHHRGHIDFNDIENERDYSGYSAYGDSKLANILFTYELARRLEGTGVTANVLHPGFVNSNFARRGNGLLVRLFMNIVSPIFGISPEEGAETVVYLASSPEVEGVTGKYYVECEAKRSSDESYDEEVARELWRVSERMVGVETPV